MSAAEKFERIHVKPRAGRTLVVGSRVYGAKQDRRALYADALGVDMLEGTGVDRVLNLEAVPPADLGLFDHVECLSVLEHSRRPWLLAENLQALMVPGATLHLMVPFVWRVHDYPGDYFRYTDQGVRSLFPDIRWEYLGYASEKLRADHFLRGQDFEGHPHFPRCEVVGFGVRT